MKGLHHSVIEIKDTQNSDIEKILVFLRPGQHKIDVDTTRKEAQEILQKVKIRQKIPGWSQRTKLFFITVFIAFAVSLIRMIIF
ncbi:MAG: hypothetical protein IKJ05_06560 [Oscillospiraceae bacterium]|nr:hypothetical protein [Oscillospiraceae bacterium]